MSQFTYKLNEVRMREQLRSLAMPLTEAAWEQFSRFHEAHARPVVKRALPNIKLQLDRKVVTSSVLALCIIVAGIILLRFVDMTKAGAKAAPATKVQPVVPMPQITESDEPIPQPLNTANTSVENGLATVNTKPEIKTETQQIKPDPLPAAPSEAAISSAPERQPHLVKAKRRNSGEIMVPETMQDIRPTPVTDDADQEERPQ